MERLIAILLVIAGVVNVYPAVGILGSSQLSKLYGLSFEETNLLILMRHRAVLFGVVGAFMIYAAFDRNLQVLAFIIGLVSMLSFVALVLLSGGYNSQLARVLIADIVASILVGIAWVLYGFSGKA